MHGAFGGGNARWRRRPAGLGEEASAPDLAAGFVEEEAAQPGVIERERGSWVGRLGEANVAGPYSCSVFRMYIDLTKMSIYFGTDTDDSFNGQDSGCVGHRGQKIPYVMSGYAFGRLIRLSG